MTETIGIVIAFVLLAASLGWILVFGGGKWWARAVLIVGTIYAGIVMWASIGSVSGWPVVEAPPDSGVEIYGILVTEPSRDGQPGAIYIWGKPTAGEQTKAPRWLFTLTKGQEDEPRCWRMPYNMEMHKRIEGARKSMAMGHKVVMKKGAAPPDSVQVGRPDGTPTDGQDGNKNGNSLSPYREDIFDFYDLPYGSLPKKDR